MKEIDTDKGHKKEIDPFKGWWLPGDFIFHPEQVKWYVACYEIMCMGSWPKDPCDVRSEQISPIAYFENPEAVWMEFLPRFKSTGRDGEMAIDFYCYQKDSSRLAEIYNLDRREVEERVIQVITYISGLKRKDRSYSEHFGHRKTGARAHYEQSARWRKKHKRKFGR